MINVPKTVIVSPSDFKIRLLPPQGMDFSTDYYAITFFIAELRYEIVNDPANDIHTNCQVDGEDLLVIFENYPFTTGTLNYVEHLKKADSVYSDNEEDTYTQRRKLNIEFIR